ncbi:hypothetical protein pb186bvf_018501 [Paramecium bursaria]
MFQKYIQLKFLEENDKLIKDSKKYFKQEQPICHRKAIEVIHIFDKTTNTEKLIILKIRQYYKIKRHSLVDIQRYDEAIQMFETYFLLQKSYTCKHQITGILIDQNYWKSDETIMIQNRNSIQTNSQAYIVKELFFSMEILQKRFY